MGSEAPRHFSFEPMAAVNVINLNQNISRHLWIEMPAGDGLFLAIG